MSNLYNRIEELCRAEGITITEMCRRADVPRGNLTDLKKGRQSGLSTANLTKIANCFSVSVDYLLNGEKETEKEKAPTLSSEDLATLDKINRLDDADRRYIEGMIDAYLSQH